MVNLDTRPARNDLTSRECAKLLCGVIQGAAMTGARMDLLRDLICALSRSPDLHEVLMRPDLNQALAAEQLRDPRAYRDLVTCAGLIGSLVGALDDQASGGSLDIALDWVLEQDAVWAVVTDTN